MKRTSSTCAHATAALNSAANCSSRSAMTVLNTLKPGLDEKLYERALVIELRKQGLRCEQQKSHDVFYDGQHIGSLIPDLIVEETVIVDPKVVSDFNDTHIAQMLGT